jgi:putative hydrolases of HD superfamily
MTDDLVSRKLPEGHQMKHIVNLLFEARKLKHIPRSGYQFLEVGKESVAEHSFMTVFIAYVMARMNPDADADRLIRMCMFHDLPEARTGDLNYVQKQYVTANETRAIEKLSENLSFGPEMTALLDEFNLEKTLEAKLARDADQIAFILDLKALIDMGHAAPKKWLAHVTGRVKTKTGKDLVETIMKTDSDAWWLADYSDNFVDMPDKKN